MALGAKGRIRVGMGSAVVALWLLVAGVLRLRRALVVTVGLGLGRTLAVTVRLALRGVSVVALWRRTSVVATLVLLRRRRGAVALAREAEVGHGDSSDGRKRGGR